MAPRFSVIGVPGIPMVESGDDLSEIISGTLKAQGLTLEDGDVLCLAQKIISKAEGQTVSLASIEAGPEAIELAAATNKDPRMVQLILNESSEVMRHKPNVLVVRHHLGIVGAHAGIDQSNVDHSDGEQALLLPKNPDHSAALIREQLQQHFGVQIGVVITDSHNRAWRMGTIGSAIGCAGIKVLDDFRGGEDIYGRSLQATLVNRADALASSATLMMGETTEKLPVVILRGLPKASTLTNDGDPAQTAQDINRPLAEDMFR
ncbi:coenzyme F420-0:L-glutamate ligase [Pseudomonadales bacterium]|nr:coenzyme F420-0:L-glutamate ligase [Pseudomonadales bacterium]MDA9905430.1 coenzyme F420-0:L-glutamate ligase [Pseudomonadales bacterium]